MGTRLEEKIQREIRRRAFKRRDRLRHKKLRQQGIQHTLDALYEVTDLSRAELEAIAGEVRLSCMCYDENFFSIKNQILVTSAIFGFVIVIGWLFIRL